jgi:cobalt-zinc-cadmium efflux system protein
VNGTIVIWVASFGIVINFGSALLFKKKQKEDINVKAAYWHLLADALVSLGVVVAGVLIHYTQWYFIDGVTAIIIAMVILYSTWDLFKDSMIAVLDGVPSGISIAEIRNHLLEIPNVLDVHHIHIWSISTNENAITCHVKIENMNQFIDTKKIIKEELEEHHILHSTIEFEAQEEQCKDEKKMQYSID